MKVKRFCYLKEEDDTLLGERAEEEAVSVSRWITEAVLMRLMLTDSEPRERPAQKEAVDYGTMVQTNLALPKKMMIAFGIKSDEDGYPSRGACHRELIRVYLGWPLPEKIPRAPRNKELSEDARMGFHADSFNEMRKVRSQPKGETVPVYERIRAEPTAMFPVNLCRVPKCPNSDLGLHKHPGNQLAGYADAVEAGGRT